MYVCTMLGWRIGGVKRKYHSLPRTVFMREGVWDWLGEEGGGGLGLGVLGHDGLLYHVLLLLCAVFFLAVLLYIVIMECSIKPHPSTTYTYCDTILSLSIYFLFKNPEHIPLSV